MEEVCCLQVKLEEQEETNKTLDEVNAVLRSQLESAVRGNETLARDVQRLGEEHQRQRKDHEQRVRNNGSHCTDNLTEDGQSIKREIH